MRIGFVNKLVQALLVSSPSWDDATDPVADLHNPQQHVAITNSYKPVVIWHGLGDNYNSSGIHKAVDILEQHYPGINVYSISLDEDPASDQQLSVFGDANKELQQTCDKLKFIPDLKQGFDAIGFSQGGIFLRGLVEKCSDISVSNLITFGSPHMGVSELPLCKQNDWVCKKRNQFLKRQVWHESVQKRIIPAQYFRDPVDYDSYLKYSNFLADINNERDVVNLVYRERLKALDNFVMIEFSEDTTLVPKESASFKDYTPFGSLIEFEDTKIYTEDRLGLQELNKAGKIKFLTVDGDHMEIPEELIHEIAKTYLGSSH